MYRRGMQFARFRAGRPGAIAIDAAVAVAACLVTALELALGSGIQGPAAVNAVAAAAATLPLALRRRWPVSIAVFVTAVIVVQEALNGDLVENTWAPLLIVPMAVYAVAAFCDRRRAFIGLVAVLVLVWIEVAVADRTTGGDYLFVALLTFGPWLVGRIVAARSELAAELSDKADRLAPAQGEQGRPARTRAGEAGPTRRGPGTHPHRARAARRGGPQRERDGGAGGRGAPDDRPRRLEGQGGALLGRANGPRGAPRDAPGGGDARPARRGARARPAAERRGARLAGC